MDTLLYDLRAAARSLFRARGVVAVAAGSLALGIAANTTIFTLVQAVEFPRLPYPDAARLVFVETRNDERGLEGMLVSPADAEDLKAGSQLIQFAGVAADQSSVLRLGESATRLAGRRVEPAFFDALGLLPAQGRTIGPADRQGVIVLSHPLWRETLSADPDIIGRDLALDGGLVTVIGVMPPGFDPDAEFWTPLAGSPASLDRADRRFMLFARLRPSATVQMAARELAAISTRLAAEYPATNRGWVMYPVELSRLHGRDARRSFLLLQAAVGFVLLIACANIANILLARGTRRRHEMAVRMALGVSRLRLIRSLLFEALLLSLLGGAAGLLLALWGIQLAETIGGFPETIEPRLNFLVLMFTAGLSAVTGVACGIVPAVRASSIAADSVLREGGRGPTGDARSRLRASLGALQIAAAVVLTVCAVLMLKSFLNRQRVDLGFDPRFAVRGDVMFTGDRYAQGSPAIAVAVDGILDTLQQNVEVVAAGGLTWALPTSAGALRQLTLPSEQDRALSPSIRRAIAAVTPQYFEALAVPLRLGRSFTPADRPGRAPVAVVNDELARHLWPGSNPIGERLRLGAPDEPAPIVTIVGVVTTIRRSGMHDTPIGRVYVPFAQYPNPGVTFVVRGRDTQSAAAALQAAVSRTDPMLIVDGLRTVSAEVAEFLEPVRLVAWLLALFSGTGVLLAALGVFGTMTYTVSQRRHELAVRSALGADRRHLHRLVFGSALRITAAGVALGIVLALVAARSLGSLLFGVTSGDLSTYAGVTCLLAVTALIASFRPARLAASADPGGLLRAG